MRILHQDVVTFGSLLQQRDFVVIEQVFDNDKAVLMKLIYLVVRKRLLGHQCLKIKGCWDVKRRL